MDATRFKYGEKAFKNSLALHKLAGLLQKPMIYFGVCF